VKSNLAEQFVAIRRDLEAERDQLAARMRAITDALAGGEIPIPLRPSRPGRPPKSAASAVLPPQATTRRNGGMSAAGRARVAAAQRARWAKIKAMKGNGAKGKLPTPTKAPGRPKRKISAAGRARIAAAQKARWAKLKAGKNS
jgi:hypothetical protein